MTGIQENRDVAADVVATWSRDWPNHLPQRSREEQAYLEQKARDAVERLQASANRARSDGDGTHRALHARELFATAQARFSVVQILPDALSLGPLVPGKTWQAHVRLSNAFPLIRGDSVPDQRGIAVRIATHSHRLDLLATTGEAHAARDGAAMIAMLHAAAASASGSTVGRISAFSHLVRALGIRDALQMTRTVSESAAAGVALPALTFYSRAPFQLGSYAVRYRFSAMSDALHEKTNGSLSDDLQQRLSVRPVKWAFDLQGFIDNTRTPLDDHRIRWDSPWLTVAELTLPQVDASSAYQKTPQLHDTTAHPVPSGFDVNADWPDQKGAVFYPLGELNALRSVAYETSRRGRGALAR